MYASQYSPEVVYDEGVPLIPNISPVLILQGNNFQLGYQYAKQLYDVFGPWILERMKHEFTEEELLALKCYHDQIQKYAPEWIEILKGRSAGAKACGVDLSFEEVEIEMCRSLLSRFQMFPCNESDGYADGEYKSKAQEILPEGCSGLAAWGTATKDGKLICAGSADHPISWTATVIVIPEEGNSYITQMVAPQTPGQHPAMNNKGLAYAHHGQPIYGDEEAGYGLPANIHLHHTLRYANNVEEAIEMQRSYPKGQKAGGLWVDVNGGNAVLESRYPLSIRHAGDYGEEDFIYASNTQLGKDLERFTSVGVGYSCGWPTRYYDHGGWNTDDLDSVRRNLQMWNLLHNYHAEIDDDFFEMLWRQPSKSIDAINLKVAEEEFMSSYGEGWDSYIGNLGNCFVGVMKPDDGPNGTYKICLGAPGRHAQPLTEEYYYFPINPLHVFVELKLAADAEAVCRAAKTRSQFDLYYANKELRKLTYGNSAYVPLDEQFNQAAIESHKGEFFMVQASKAQGSEAVCFWARATRCFVRSQALSRNICGLLIKQPEMPEELGLKEWFGDWGEWESVDSCKPE